MVDYSVFLEYSAEEIYEDWLNYIKNKDPLLQDDGLATFNSILAEAIAAQFYIFLSLLKQKIKDSSILTATGAALTAIVLAYLPEGRYPASKATGYIKFMRTSKAPYDITVPKGTLCGMLTESGKTLEFRTTEEATLLEDTYYITAPAEASAAGSAYNVGTGLINFLLSSVVGVSAVLNEAPFTGGDDGESDTDLRNRALYTIWLPGKATVPLIQEHLEGVEGVREAKVDTIGQGDVLIIVDSEGGITDPEPEIGEMLYENLGAGCTAPGILGASIRPLPDRIIGEVVNETPDGIITTFTVDNAFAADTEEVLLNGIIQQRNVDYTPNPGAGSILVLWTPIPDAAIGDVLTMNYLKAGDDNTFEIGDCSGGKVWVRTLQYIDTETEVPFSYRTSMGLVHDGTATFPQDTPAGSTIEAVLEAEEDLASVILSSTYDGGLKFDIYMGLGTYPHLWTAPELQLVDIAGEIVFTGTPEVNLLDNIKESLRAKLASYKIGDVLQHSDVYRYAFFDYATGRVFSGIDDIPTFALTCKVQTIDFGESLAIDSDERIEPGDMDGLIEAT